jgi:hypothetical protein
MTVFSFSWQEFECDLSVEGGVDLRGQERQEFSFTLYDFDGHGKITKDVSLLKIKYIYGSDYWNSLLHTDLKTNIPLLLLLSASVLFVKLRLCCKKWAFLENDVLVPVKECGLHFKHLSS